MTKQAAKRDCEVLVVGAGPTGLMAANLLKRAGIDVRIVDERADASPESRAFGIQARTMELLQRLGLVEGFFAQGVLSPFVDFYVGGERLGGLNYDRVEAPDTPYPFTFLLPQSKTEALLLADLSRLKVEVEREVKITGLSQDADGVLTRATGAGGAVREIRSAYVVGADGAHSVVRKTLGLAFEGAKYAQSFMLADCRVEWPLDHVRFRIFMNGENVGLFLPLDGARTSRVMVTDPSGKAEGSGPEATRLELSEMQAALAHATGMEVKLSDPLWTTRYRVHHRIVDRYREGRVFVAGDAAHIHSPAGGQGMNTGIQDAANLAWKLATVLRGGHAGLLDTYDTERRPVGHQVIATSDTMFNTVAGRTGWEATVRDWLARPVTAALTHLKPLQQAAFRVVSELDIAYGPSRYVDTGAGHRAPNAAIARHRDVFDLLEGYHFTVLAFSRRPLSRTEAHGVADALDTLTGEGVVAHLISRLEVGTDPRVVFVSATQVFDTYGVDERDGQVLCLVRPDGYIAWRADSLDIEGCRQFLARFRSGAVRAVDA